MVRLRNITAVLLQRLPLFWALTKPTITLMVLVATSLGYYLSAKSAIGTWNWGTYFVLIIGSAFTSGGVATLNEFWERDTDLLMERTRRRPLPSGRLAAWEALLFGLTISLVGIGSLYLFVNPVTGLLAALTLLTYVFVYTPLKRITTWNTLVGAIPGALPPVGGWIAASGTLSTGAWVLFAILYAWQIPHFLAIAQIYKDDYGRGGIKMLPTVDQTGTSTAFHIIGFCIILLVASLIPTLIGIASWGYFVVALAMGLAFLKYGISAARSREHRTARKLLLASIAYLPALMVIIILDQELLLRLI